MRLPRVALIVAMVTACSGGADSDASTTTVPASTTTEAAAATTTVPATTTTVAPTTTLDEANRAAWQLTAADHRGEIDTQYDYECSGPGFLYSVWGTDIYTDDSSVCSAAVHAGVITVEQGGTVTIEMRAGEASYGPSEANGVTSGEWGQWHTSFVFVG